jgi:hypothetical protein
MHEYFLVLMAILYLTYYTLNRVFVTSAAFKVCYILFSLFAVSMLLL